MKSADVNFAGSSFYFKVSSEPFEFDTTLYGFKHVHKTARSVFMSRDADIRVTEANGRVELFLGTPTLSHAHVIWNEASSKLEVKLDPFGIQSVFVHEAGNSIYLANRIDILALTLRAPELCDFALSFYLLAGFLPSDRTFWKKIRRVQARSDWDLTTGRSNHEVNARWEPVRSKKKFSPGEVIEALKESLARIEKEIAPTQMRLSGGADTRIVSYLWNSPIEAVAVRSPWMSPGTDLDVNLAKAWAELRGFPFRELEPDAKNFAFFGEPPGRPMLTGLCGGEFLGGQFEHAIPSNPRKWRAALDHDFHPEVAKSLRSDSWFREVSEDEDRWLSECARVFVQSSRSTIYGSLVGSWSAPSELHLSTVSPFVTAPFLEIFTAALGSWQNYEFYERVFRELGPELSRVPLSSQLTIVAPDLAPNAADAKGWGEEPKVKRPKMPMAPLDARAVSRWISILRENGVVMLETEIQRLLTESTSRANAISLFNWVMTRFKV